tara:strand:+ start:2613 stop:2936 length:324 start_codon:yes stop_codon:yes gene_type:complete
MKIGVSISIDVTKIDKGRLVQGTKGKYLDLITFIDTDQQDQYGKNGFVAHSVGKQEREQGVKGAILGNVKVFYDDSQQPRQQAQPSQQPQGGFCEDVPGFEDDNLPF